MATKDNVSREKELIKKLWTEICDMCGVEGIVEFDSVDKVSGSCEFGESVGVLGNPYLDWETFREFLDEVKNLASEEYVCWPDYFDCSHINYETGENDGGYDPEEVLNTISQDDADRSYLRETYERFCRSYGEEISELLK